MPTYRYCCEQGHVFEQVSSIRQHQSARPCECGKMAEQLITAPLLAIAQPECRYDSPVDGRIITTWDQRREDLKRNNCRPYDPEMKTDAARFHKEMDAKVDQQIDEQVERTFEKMPTKQRGQLASEVLDQGVGLDVGRASGNPLA